MSRRPIHSARSVGKNVLRAEGREKLTGEARYIDDLHLPGLLYGRTVRSTIPRGRILSVTLDPAFDWSAFTIVDHKDIPGKNVVAMIVDDQPYLAVDRVNHQAEPILLLAHAERARVDEALKHVESAIRRSRRCSSSTVPPR
jgi:CO/xanthine dehydrogenase Mo-binding subunit